MVKSIPLPAPDSDGRKTPAHDATGRTRSRAGAAAKAGLHIVAIGTAVGGVDAALQLLQALPQPSGLICVLVLRGQAQHGAATASVLRHATRLPVRIAKHGSAPRADTVYINPAGKLLGLENGRFALRDIVEAHESEYPIDHFFSGLATELRERAAAIVLADTGGDGARGLAAVAAHGGLALADSASGMARALPGPTAAAAQQPLAVPTQNMPTLLQQRLAPQRAAQAALQDPANGLTPVLQRLQTRCGFDAAQFDPVALGARIDQRMAARSMAAIAAYCELLDADARELQALHGDLLIGRPEFFCVPEFWRALETDVLAPLVASKHADEAIRVWMPGISRGEDAYTLALALMDQLETTDKHCPIRIFATSSNENVLAFARAGTYPARSTERVEAIRLARYFLPSDAGRTYRVGSRLHECVLFGLHDLLVDPPFSRIDLVICRGLLGALDHAERARSLQSLHFALNPSGFLVAANADALTQAGDRFRRVSDRLAAFRRSGAGGQPGADSATNAGARTPDPAPDAALVAPLPAHTIPAATVARQLILDHFAPPCVLLNHRQEIQYFSGRTEQYLRQPHGKPTGKLLVMLRDGLRATLTRLLSAAHDTGGIAIDTAHVKRDGKYHPLQVTVLPSGEGNDCIYLVVFQELPHDPPAGQENELTRRLEEELRVTKDDLRRTTRLFETSGDELQIAREQIVSLTEELQSANEEAARLREELQSHAEELSTVNQQSQVKEAELSAAGTDFQNLLAASEIATVYLDRRLRLRWFTPAIQELIRLQPSDIGRPITDFEPALTGVSLLADSGLVLAENRTAVAEFKSVRGRWLQRRTAPFRTADGTPDGVMITITDITESKNLAEGYAKLTRDSAAVEARREELAEQEQQVLERTRRLRGIAFNSAQAAELEHRRIARVIHDDLLQQIALIGIKFGSLRTPIDAGSPEFADLRGLLDGCARGARQIVAELSPPGLYEFGLAPAFEWLASEMKKQFGLTVRLSLDSTPYALPSGIAAVLFRSVRELLINVAKHARVRSALLELSCTDEGALEITVSDAGLGFEPERLPESTAGGFGLASVRETVTMMGGTVRLESAPRSGTTVTLHLPLPGGNATLKAKPMTTRY